MEKGTTISHYTILEKLGEGGMGVVYKARDTKLDRDVALKFLPLHLTASDENRQRFIREAKAAAALNHPNICTIYNVDEHEGIQFIVMEYIDGSTLRDLQKSGNLEPEMAIDYAVQIAEALSKAHDAGIIHRDIKPGNIMVNADGHIKVMDFGLAKLKGSAEEITKTGSTVGTIAYMAPEQIQAKEVGPRADIFAFGVVFFEMLAGVRPFRGEHEAALMYSIVNEDPIALTMYLPDAPAVLIHIIKKALQKNPEDRYQSIEVLTDKLREVELKGSEKVTDPDVASSIDAAETETQAIAANSDSLTITLWKIKSRAGRAVALITVAVLASLIYLFVYVPDETEALELAHERVLVVPFENSTGDSSLDPVGRTAADWITQGILQSGVVEAVQTTTTLQLIGEGDLAGGGFEVRTRLVELAGHTNADIVISGRYIQIGDDIRFETQIVDAQRNEVIYTLDPVRGPRSDPMEVINELQQNILVVLSIHVYPGFDLEFYESPPVYDAYVAYLGALRHWASDLEKTIEYAERAVEIDPDFIGPWIVKGYTYWNMGQYAKADSVLQYVNTERERLSPYHEIQLDLNIHLIEGNRHEAFATALQWGRIAPKDLGVNYAIGLFALRLNQPQMTIDTFSEFEFPQELTETDMATLQWWYVVFSRAYHLLGEHERELETVWEGFKYFPEDLILREREAEAHAAMGDIENVHNVIEESKAIDDPARGSPGFVILVAAMELRSHGHKQVSLELAAEAAAWYRDHEPITLNQVHSLTYAEVWAEAYEMAKELAADEPGNVEYLGELGVLAALLGDDAKASRIEQALAEIDRDYLFGEHLYQRARIKAILGEQQEAVQLLEASFEQGKRFGLQVHREITFEPLKGFEPYEQFLEP